MIETIETMEELLKVDFSYINACVIVHSGIFHAHDVFACVHADYVIRTRNTDVIRHIEETLLSNCITVDVGLGELDHHAWKGYKGLETMFPHSLTIECGKREDAYTQILESIAKIDCGEEAIDYVSSMISSFNPCWNEPCTHVDYDRQFERALDFAKLVLIYPDAFITLKERELARESGKAEAASIVDQAMFESAGSSLLVLPRFVPWQEKVVNYNELAHNSGKLSFLWVLFPSPDETYRVQSVPKTVDSMEFHTPVGAKPDDKGFVFCHPNKFICGYTNKDDAVRAVRSW